MASQRTFLTTYERLERFFKRKPVDPVKASSTFINIYPRSSEFFPTDIICGILYFINEKCPNYKIDNNDLSVEINGSKCKMDLKSQEFSVVVSNYTYTSTVRIEILYKSLKDNYTTEHIVINQSNYYLYRPTIEMFVYHLSSILSKMYLNEYKFSQKGIM